MAQDKELLQELDHFAKNIVDTVREPLLVLDTDLRIKLANRAFCQTFQVTPEETENQLIFALGNGQWDIPGLRTLLEQIVPQDSVFNDFEAAHDFPVIGPRTMLLNARKLYRPGNHTALIVLAMEDVTERRQAEAALAASYRLEHHLAEALQESLLLMPPANAFPGLSVATLYEAASRDALVGGDFCDAYALEEGKVALVVGDVMGKGLTAAIHTAKVKYALRAFLREYPQPAQALERLNSFLFDAQRWDSPGENAEEAIVCLGVVVLSPLTGELTVSLAGFEPPLILRQDGQTETITAHGLPLGVAPKAEYKTAQTHLAAGDLLLLTTDGLTEARHGKSFLGYDGLETLAQQAAALPSLEQMCRFIFTGAHAFSHGPLADDACLLLARRENRRGE